MSKKVVVKTSIEVNIVESVKIVDKTLTIILPFATPIILVGILIIGYTIPTW